MATKVGEAGPLGGARPVSSVRRAGTAQSTQSVAPVRAPEDSILVMGIPEPELTPRVKAAITKLMDEVFALRRELEMTKRRLDELELLADEDTLMPVLNRRAFVRELTRTKNMLERYGQKASLIYIDMNNFKDINDAHGHAVGDEALKHVATLLKGSVRSTDTVGRLGGDEFGVILTRATREQAQMRAEAIAKSIVEKPLNVGGRKITLSIAYGVCEVTASGDIEAELHSADRAMYEHKKGKSP
jgi:diguanylate cyclase (GGDEF)-like protein